MASVVALALLGCASSSIQTDATAFLNEHLDGAARAAAATKAVEAAVSQLSSSPTGPQLQRLALAAGEARRELVGAGDWSIGEGGEEEDVPRAEGEVTEGASELARAMSALSAYARAPSATALARYRSDLTHGRERWNEGISHLFYLAHESHPPTL